MAHPLVAQLRFARSEFVRGLDGVSEADGLVRQLPMNSLGWMVGHMANQAREFMMIDVVVLSIIIYALLGKLADWLARFLERHTLSWNPAFQGR